MHDEDKVPIWFFIGSMLLLYGIVIAATGVYGWVFPPPVGSRVALWDLHADVWWGLFMAVIGAGYTIKFHPFKKKAE